MMLAGYAGLFIPMLRGLNGIVELPSLGTSFTGLMAVSHASYLGFKATQENKK